ncbi:MAG TPA: cytochrome c oxidase assembly protein [Gaiellaceae bacterium]|jgi:cytochrome c oxidase assembly factor CtaG|nr:cytochrome c oxidase assembly protein [Gaiellaceae bacterium]
MHLSAEAVGLVPALALAYVLAARRYPPGRPRITVAVAGLALVLLAFSTELEPLALHTFLWAHLLQNVVLAEWAPALLVLAVPPALATRARDFTLFRPLVALPLWIGTYFVWHLPWVYDFALEHPHSLLHVEHVTYLAAGVALWWPAIHGDYSAGAKAAYLFGAFVLASPLGLLLALIPRPIYSFYEHARRTWGPGPLVDQQIAGVTMAIEQALVFFAVFAAFMLRFLRDEQAAGTAFTRHS